MPDRLLTIAQEQLDATPYDQARLRSAVNRAYYAAFLTGRTYCDEKALVTGTGASHEKVIHALLDHPNLAKRGNQLNEMKRLRHKADYDWDRDISPRDAKKTLKTCRELVAFFQFIDPPVE
ncbi:HEPN domain-containing protein [Chromohalobacter nigrandesensis]|uniref:HEPN domain-containing protein n=1 Tax=Chromohalobacter nigrandesensis TaxID=119863 RepID=UPI001FF663BA|nr:HEPN domain-containing protein [Chromohalobacter nigrandesensis]MCK0744116.1 HEPN domain-containing protein [Chromohalobacter nigrandesensis]